MRDRHSGQEERVAIIPAFTHDSTAYLRLLRELHTELVVRGDEERSSGT